MTKVKSVPDGYGTVTPMLNIKGAAEAIEFYKKAFGAEERFRMPGPNNTIMHAELQIGSSVVMIAESLMSPPTQTACHLYVENCDAWWKRATEAGCTVTLELNDAFWGDRFGVVSDKFGNRWSIATHKEDVSPADMKTRAAEAMKNMK